MNELHRISAACTAQDIVGRCEADGGVIVEDWLSIETVAKFNAQVEPWLNEHQGVASGSEASDEFLGLKTKRLQGLTVKTPLFVDLMADDRLIDFAETVLAPVSPSVILNNGELIEICPGETRQPLHRDDDAWNFARAGGPLMINVIVALVDITPDMGSTLVVPGSHGWDRNRIPESGEIKATSLTAGSALFFRGDLLHAGGDNTSSKNRRALSIGICCGWLRPVENSYTNVPLDIVKTLPKKAQELLGYALYDASEVGGGYLGYHDLGDPAQLLNK